MPNDETEQLPLAVRLLGAILFTVVPPLLVGLIFSNTDATSWTVLVVWIITGIWGVHIYRTGFDDSGSLMVVLGPIWLTIMIYMGQERPTRT